MAKKDNISSKNSKCNTFNEDDVTAFLEHYGVLGMKWGVRRTPEQLGHTKKQSKRGTEALSNEELSARVNRLRLESEYERLARPKRNTNNKGKNFIISGLEKSGQALVSYYATKYGKKGVEWIIKRYGSSFLR